MSSNIKGNMTEGSPAKCMLFFALPMIIGNLFQQFYSIVDSIIVGKMVGKEALAAVGASTALTQLFVMMALGVGIGCSVVISQLFGANELAKMKSAISTALLSILVLSVVLSLVGRVLSAPILTAMGTPADVFEQAKVYLDIYFYGFFFLFLYNAFTAVFNALGNSKIPLAFLILSSCLNIVLDIIFVRNFGMGVAGAAWATFIAQAVAAVLSFIVLVVRLNKIKTEKYKRYDTNLLTAMIKIAVPTVIQQSIVSIGMLLIQSAVNRFGSVYLAGYTAAIRIDGIAIVPIVNVGNAVSTFVAQNIGAKKYDRVKQGYRFGIGLAIGIGAVIGIALQIFGSNLIGLFMDANDAAESIAVGASYIGVISIFYFVFGMMNVTNAVLRGAGDVKWGLASTFTNLLSRVIVVFAFAGITAGAIISWSNPMGWFLGFLIAFIRYKQGGWKDIKLIKGPGK